MKDPADVLKENPASLLFAHYAQEIAERGNTDEALEILSNGINANPDYAAGYSVLAGINMKQGLHEAAIEHLEKALALEPQSPKDLLNLGKYLSDNNTVLAKEYLWKAHRYEPDSSETKAALNALLTKLGDEPAEDALPEPAESDADESAKGAKAPVKSGLDLLKPIEVTDDSERKITPKDEEETVSGEDEWSSDPFAEMLGDVDASDDAPAAETTGTLPEKQDEQKDSGIDQTDGTSEEVSEQVEDETGGVSDEEESDAYDEPLDDIMAGDGLSSDEAKSAMEDEYDGEPAEDDAELMHETEDELPDSADETEPFGESAEPEITEETAVGDGLMPETEDTMNKLSGETETSEDDITVQDKTDTSEEIIIERSGEIPAETDEVKMEEPTGEQPEESAGDATEEEITADQQDETAEKKEIEDDDDFMQEFAAFSAEEEDEEEEEEGEEVLEPMEEIPGYSNILDDRIPEAPEFDINKTEEKVLELNEDDSEYDISKFEQDISGESLEEPALPADEKAELLKIEQSQHDEDIQPDTATETPPAETPGSGESTTPAAETVEPENTGRVPDETAEPEDMLEGGIYGDLSSDEIDLLSETDSEPDDEDNDLETETREGIDYSDILYGKKSSIDTDDAAEQPAGKDTIPPSNDLTAEPATREPDIADMTQEDFDAADTQDKFFAAETDESTDTGDPEKQEEPDSGNKKSTMVRVAEDLESITGDDEKSPWDISIDDVDTDEETTEHSIEDTAPEPVGSFDLDDSAGVDSDEPSGEESGEDISGIMTDSDKAEEIDSGETDRDESTGELSYADLLDANEIDLSGFGDESEPESESDDDMAAGWDIPDEYTQELSGNDFDETSGDRPSITGEYSLEEPDDEEPSDTATAAAGDDEMELSPEQQIERLASSEYDEVDDDEGNSSYADLLVNGDDDSEPDDNGFADTTESRDDLTGQNGWDILAPDDDDMAEDSESENDITGGTGWDIPGDLADETDESATDDAENGGAIHEAEISEDEKKADSSAAEDKSPWDTADIDHNIEKLVDDTLGDDIGTETAAASDEDEYSGGIDIEIPDTSGAEDSSEDDAALEEPSEKQVVEDLSIMDIDDDMFRGDTSDEDMSNGNHYFGFPADDNELEEIENSSIGDLIYDYVAAIKETGSGSGTAQTDSAPADSPNESGGKTDGETAVNNNISYDFESEDELPPDGEATATMAEIFVSQGLTNRAIQIYKALHEQKPDNEEILKRLKELQRMLESPTGDE